MFWRRKKYTPISVSVMELWARRMASDIYKILGEESYRSFSESDYQEIMKKISIVLKGAPL